MSDPGKTIAVLDYAPAAPRWPAGLTALGVIGLVYGLSAFMNHLARFVSQSIGQSNSLDFIDSFYIVNAIVSIVLAVILIVGSAGCFMGQRWARGAMLGWAVTYIIATAVNTILLISVILPGTNVDPFPSHAEVSRGVLLAAGLLMVLPVAVIVVMLTKRVSRYYEELGLSKGATP